VKKSMRILHVANFNIHKYGADLYAIDRKISAGLIRNGHYVYDFSYRDVCRNESLFRTTKLGTAKLNRKLLEACDTICPQILLLGHSELIEGATLAEIKSRHPMIRIGLWYVDPLFHKEKTTHLFNRLASIDVLFATTGGKYLKEFASATTCAAFIPNIVDPAVESQQAFLGTSHDYDFVFCGRDSHEAERQEFMTRLNVEAAKNLRCAFRGCLGFPLVTGAAFVDFLGSAKMSLSISRRNDVFLYSSDRLMQLTGNGLLTFSPNVPGMRTLFSDDELVYYDDFDDLLEKLIYYHHHGDECKRVAESGWKRVHNCYNNQRVTRYMIEKLLGLPLSSEYEWQKEIFGADPPLIDSR
jgi:hypothetical protein